MTKLPITIPATPAIIAKSKNFFLSNILVSNQIHIKTSYESKYSKLQEFRGLLLLI
jgi:hypothetical protein